MKMKKYVSDNKKIKYFAMVIAAILVVSFVTLYWITMSELQFWLVEDVLFYLVEVLVFLVGIVIVYVCCFQHKKTLLRFRYVVLVWLLFVFCVGSLVYYFYNDSIHSTITQEQVKFIEVNGKILTEQSEETELINAFNDLKYIKRNFDGIVENTPDKRIIIKFKTEEIIEINEVGQWISVQIIKKEGNLYYWGKNEYISEVIKEKH